MERGRRWPGSGSWFGSQKDCQMSKADPHGEIILHCA